ncbi:MAG: cytochrome c peroxidase [Burkholderiales bacterium]
MQRRWQITLACLLLVVPSAGIAGLTAKESLGKLLFFDRNLSLNGNQACSSCHLPEAGWSGDDSTINAHGAAYEGSIAGRFGNRRPPSAAYATPSPVLHFVKEDGATLFLGGNFWNGRATGEKLGNPAADQAERPFLNPVEQGLSDGACVVFKACAGYTAMLERAWPGTCAIAWPDKAAQTCSVEGGRLDLSRHQRAKAELAFGRIALGIAAFEASAEVNAYTSKFDYFLAGRVRLLPEEKLGLELFKGKGRCADCHVLDKGPNGEPPLLTDFTFDNIGVPRNPENPWYAMPASFNPDGRKWLDQGLGEFLASRADYRPFASDNYGKQKVPTLRNVDKRPGPAFVKAYMHNGYFKTLKGVVHFYNTRDTRPACADPFTTEAGAIAQDCWPEAQIKANLNTSELGDLGLTDAEEDAIVKFMQTLSDGFEPPPGTKRLAPGLRR